MVFACKWLSIREALIKDGAERPDVATFIGRLAAKLLRRHVGKCPEQTTGLSLGGIHDARDPEVHDFDGAIGGDHDVSRLDITMNYAVGERNQTRGKPGRSSRAFAPRARADEDAITCSRLSPSRYSMAMKGEPSDSESS